MSVDEMVSRPGLVGQRVKRLEDPHLLTGRGMFVDDRKLPGTLHLIFVRSTAGHAYIRKIDTSRASRHPGVKLVLTGAEVNRRIGPLPVLWQHPGLRNTEYQCMASEKARYAGQAIALIVADDRYIAQDALALVAVEYERLPVVLKAADALLPGAPLLFEEWGTNETFPALTIAGGDVDAAFAEADRIITARLYSHRYSGIPLETRGCLATYDDADDLLTIYTSTQAPNQVRTGISTCLGLSENTIRVVARDVGGGFGIKDQVYPEEVLVSYAARLLGKPVKWIESRQEHMQASTHAREQHHDVELAVKNDGTLLAIKDCILYDAGAHHTTRGALPAMITASSLPGPYTLKAASIEIRSVVTNKVPSAAYRGFGQTQATFVMERMIDLAAAKLGMDPAEVRRKNFISPQQVSSFVTATGVTYDSGDYPAAFEKVLDLIEYSKWRELQKELRSQGRYLGIGLANFVETTGLGPAKFQAFIGFLIPSHETSRVEIDQSGKVSVFTGITPIGQGTRTTFSQIAADTLGVSLSDVRLISGDTSTSPYSGLSSVASRGTVVGGAALLLSCQKLQEKVKRIAGHLLEAAPVDIEIYDGQAFVRGLPAKTLSLREIARVAYYGANLPEGESPGLVHSETYDPPSVAFAYASHACLVEVDPETGVVEVLKYAVVHDCGTMVNPLLIEGQIHGGIAQGLGGALTEEFRYDEHGLLLSDSLQKYHLPLAAGIPLIQVEHLETPAPRVPGGFKGSGEGGTIGSTAAIVNAVADALAPFGVGVTATPLTPDRVWNLIQASRGEKQGNIHQ
jgi:aerobic carbon-monoxide dehydrogenase large subunit